MINIDHGIRVVSHLSEFLKKEHDNFYMKLDTIMKFAQLFKIRDQGVLLQMYNLMHPLNFNAGRVSCVENLSVSNLHTFEKKCDFEKDLKDKTDFVSEHQKISRKASNNDLRILDTTHSSLETFIEQIVDSFIEFPRKNIGMLII